MRTLGTLTTSLLLTATLGMLPGTTATAVPSGHAVPKDGGTDKDWQVKVLDEGDQSFRGLDAVNRKVAWVSGGSLSDGGAGKVYRTVDAGKTWDDVTPPGTEGLTLRDVEAPNARTAVVLSIGPGEDSRIYRTTDGGTTWTETFRNGDPAAFYNCLDFYPGGRRGLAVSDPDPDDPDGRFRIAATHDRGRTWHVLPDRGMPDSTGEYNFSASGDCLVIAGHTAWFGSGGARARVFRSTDHGRTWRAGDSTLPAGEAAGVFALAFRSPEDGVAVGGDFEAPGNGTDASAYTRNGRTWTHGGDLTHLAEDATWLRGRRPVVVAVGEGALGTTVFGGTSLSTDSGRSWRPVSEQPFHTLDCTPQRVCWAAGGGSRVARW